MPKVGHNGSLASHILVFIQKGQIKVVKNKGILKTWFYKKIRWQIEIEEVVGESNGGI